MSLTENSDKAFLPGGCNRTQNLRFGPIHYLQIIDNERLKKLRFSVDSLKLFKSMIHQNNAARKTLNSAGKNQTDKLTCFVRKGSAYDQEIPRAHTADQPTEEP